MVEAINTAIETTVATVLSVFTSNLGEIMAITAGLVGLALAWGLFKRFVKRPAK